MHMQKHAYGVWSTDPGPGVVADPAPYVAARSPVGIVGSPEGSATVATYSVLHGRDGQPERALLVCDVGEGPGGAGGRCYAFLEGGAAVLAEGEAEELIGRTVTITPSGGVNHATLRVGLHSAGGASAVARVARTACRGRARIAGRSRAAHRSSR